MKWYLHACPVCDGDLHDDLQDRGWLTCFMCVRSFRAVDLLEPSVPEPLRPDHRRPRLPLTRRPVAAPDDPATRVA
jgi:hypothetical protein